MNARTLALVVCLLPIAAGAAQPQPAIASAGTVQVAFVPWDDVEGLVVETISRAKKQVLVQAYNFTSRNIARALIAARKRGVDVQVTADREQTYSGESSRIPELAAAGIPVFLEVRYQSAHNKVMLIDAESVDPAVVTGSYNWTWAAQNKNAENLLVLRGNRELARAYLANWRRHVADALPYATKQVPRPEGSPLGGSGDTLKSPK